MIRCTTTATEMDGEIRFGKESLPDGAVRDAADQGPRCIPHWNSSDHLDDAVGFDVGKSESGDELGWGDGHGGPIAYKASAFFDSRK